MFGADSVVTPFPTSIGGQPPSPLSVQGQLRHLDEGEFTEGHDPLSRSRAGHCQTATRLSPHEIVKFGTSICNNRRRSPDRRPWLRSSLSQRLARGCPALETCSSAPQ